MCELCGCEEDTIIRHQVSGQVTSSSLRGIPVVAVVRPREQHSEQHTNLKPSVNTALYRRFPTERHNKPGTTSAMR